MMSQQGKSLIREKIYATVGGEAIGQALNGTIDEVAISASSGVYASKGHWAYIGSNEYSYMVAGVSYHNGTWYVALVCCQENKVQYAK